VGTTAESLYKRVDELIESHKQPIFSTTGTRSAIGELIVRTMGLEEAIREMALEFQRFEDSHEGVSADPESAAAARLSSRRSGEGHAAV
jgi:hypothetical protein